MTRTNASPTQQRPQPGLRPLRLLAGLGLAALVTACAVPPDGYSDVGSGYPSYPCNPSYPSYPSGGVVYPSYPTQPAYPDNGWYERQRLQRERERLQYERERIQQERNRDAWRARQQRECVQPKNTDELTAAQHQEISAIEARRATLPEGQSMADTGSKD